VRDSSFISTRNLRSAIPVISALYYELLPLDMNRLAMTGQLLKLARQRRPHSSDSRGVTRNANSHGVVRTAPIACEARSANESRKVRIDPTIASKFCSADESREVRDADDRLEVSADDRRIVRNVENFFGGD